MSTPDPQSTRPTESFAYRAIDSLSRPVSGTIDAGDIVEARKRLESLGLWINSIEPVATLAHAGPRQPLSATDFIAFNQQLAQLTSAQLPIEQGLQLIAQDLHGGRLAATVAAVSAELERGTPLADALAKHRAQFPPLYTQLVEAGVKSNTLGGLLLNFSAHLEMVRRLRASLWRTLSYPVMVLIGLMIVLLFLSYAVFPRFEELFSGFDRSPLFHFDRSHGGWSEAYMTIPLITQLLFIFGHAIPYIAATVLILVIVLPILWRMFAKTSAGGAERLILCIPLIGAILRNSMLARWCDVARLGVNSGLDLPAAISLAGNAIASPALARDGAALTENLESGKPIDADLSLTLMPRVVSAAIENGARTNSLRDVLGSLSNVYRRQAETQLDNLPTILSPILLVLLALAIGFAVFGLVAPVLNFIQAISGG
jgi:type II secretory pathway component PulF